MLCTLVDIRPTNIPTWVSQWEDQLTEVQVILFEGAFKVFALTATLPPGDKPPSCPITKSHE